MPPTTDTRKGLLIILVCLSVAMAGCSGWGTDGPANQDQDQDQEPNQSDDLEQADNTSQNTDSDQTDTTDSEEQTTTDGGAEAPSSDSGGDSDPPSNDDPSSDGSEDSPVTQEGDESDSSDESQQQGDSSDSSTDEGSDTSNGDTSQDASQDPSEDQSGSGDEGSSTDGSESNSDDQDQEQNQDQEQEQNNDDDRPVYDLTVFAGEAYAVEGAEITIERHSDGATTTRTTDSNGEATFTVYPGDYTVTGVDPQGNVEEEQVTVESDTEMLMSTLMREVPDSHSLTVTVIDANTGEPVEGASVHGIGGRLPSGAEALIGGETNANGKVTFDEVFEGHRYVIDVQAEGYEIESREVPIEGDETVTFGIAPEEPDTGPNQTDPNPPGNETNASAMTS